MHLCIYDWPQDGRLHLPGLKSQIESAKLLATSGKETVEVSRQGDWATFHLPPRAPEKLVSVVRLRFKDQPKVDPTWGVHPNSTTTLIAHFANVTGAKKDRIRWTEKYGEWKHKTQVSQWGDEGKATWNVDVLKPGYYRIALSYRGEDRLVWKVETDEGELIQNQQGATSKYAAYPMGVFKFHTAGQHTISVSLVDGNRDTSSLSNVTLRPLD